MSWGALLASLTGLNIEKPDNLDLIVQVKAEHNLLTVVFSANLNSTDFKFMAVKKSIATIYIS